MGHSPISVGQPAFAKKSRPDERPFDWVSEAICSSVAVLRAAPADSGDPFSRHRSHGVAPAIFFCFLWLYFSAAGPGPWSLDARVRRVT